MLKRLVLGILKGLLIGAAVAALVVKGFGLLAWTAVLAYALAATTGALTAILTGRPIWARDAKVENGIKALVGALIASIGLFALRKWMPVSVDLSMLQAGQGTLGDLPAAALPAVAVLMALIFEIDNTGVEGKDQRERERLRVLDDRKRRVGAAPAEGELDEMLEPATSERRTRR